MEDLSIQGARILIADDQEVNVLLLEEILKQAGYANVATTTDPLQVTELFLAFKPDLLLLDLNMPLMDGFEVMERLQGLKGEAYLPILVLTSDHEEATRQRALKSGAKDFLTKPFNTLEVLARIWNLLEVKLLHNRLYAQNKLLEEKVRERTRELWESRLEIIQRLSLAAEYRDDVTGGHIKRMSAYASLLAEAVGFDGKRCELLSHASRMHDIGKIRTPDHILLKPGKLTPEEWEMIKSHTTVGAQILSGSTSELLRMAEVIALTHHEKWDGSGYPGGLRGGEIPIEGRVCAVADVFDALTTERPYKRAWSIEEAVAEIEKGAGKHFDPELIEPFLGILPRIVEIKKDHALEQTTESRASSR